MKHHHEDVHSLAAAYALNAMAADERDMFAVHLRQCAACRQEAAEFEATAARLAWTTTQAPPTAMKQRTMAAIDGVRQLPPRLPATTPAAAFGAAVRRRAVPLALAACLAAAATFAGLAARQHRENEELQNRARQAERRIDDISGVLTAPDARTVHGRAGNGAVTTVVASDRQNKAVFTATRLPAPAAGKTYQLWLDHQGTMRPAGFIHQDGIVVIEGDTAGAGAVGLTLEPAGGSAQPTTPPLVLMALPA
ncbi:anti-sigma factor [Streptomyces sp. NPDC056463]|uniref:anti-sigma factor n=1 Tax=Streptomyces sp. NPDC056463 TaxID=3345827 RepID=UPI00369C2B59